MPKESREVWAKRVERWKDSGYKRLHRASFDLPESGAAERPLVAIDARTLATILRGVAK